MKWFHLTFFFTFDYEFHWFISLSLQNQILCLYFYMKISSDIKWIMAIQNASQFGTPVNFEHINLY